MKKIFLGTCIKLSEKTKINYGLIRIFFVAGAVLGSAVGFIFLYLLLASLFRIFD